MGGAEWIEPSGSNEWVEVNALNYMDDIQKESNLLARRTESQDRSELLDETEQDRGIHTHTSHKQADGSKLQYIVKTSSGRKPNDLWLCLRYKYVIVSD